MFLRYLRGVGFRRGVSARLFRSNDESVFVSLDEDIRFAAISDWEGRVVVLLRTIALLSQKRGHI